MYALEKIKKIRSRKTGVALYIGKACHAFIEAWYEGRGLDAALKALRNEFDTIPKNLLDKDELVELAIEQARSEAMMSAYTEAHVEDDRQFQKHIMEKRVQIELIPGVVYEGYIDHLAQDMAGDWWIWETKTSGKAFANADYFNRVMIDSQVCGYMRLGTEILGQPPKGVYYDVILKTSHSQRKTEALSAFIKRLTDLYRAEWKSEGLFIRREFEIPNSRVNNWLKNTRFIAAEIQAARNRAESLWPMNTDHCQAKFGTCRYLPICTSGQVDKLRYAIGDTIER